MSLSSQRRDCFSILHHEKGLCVWYRFYRKQFRSVSMTYKPISPTKHHLRRCAIPHCFPRTSALHRLRLGYARNRIHHTCDAPSPATGNANPSASFVKIARLHRYTSLQSKAVPNLLLWNILRVHGRLRDILLHTALRIRADQYNPQTRVVSLINHQRILYIW